jgi:hypothetical protein
VHSTKEGDHWQGGGAEMEVGACCIHCGCSKRDQGCQVGTSCIVETGHHVGMCLEEAYVWRWEKLLDVLLLCMHSGL